jgi:hypothetical protein
MAIVMVIVIEKAIKASLNPYLGKQIWFTALYVLDGAYFSLLLLLLLLPVLS